VGGEKTAKKQEWKKGARRHGEKKLNLKKREKGRNQLGEEELKN